MGDWVDGIRTRRKPNGARKGNASGRRSTSSASRFRHGGLPTPALALVSFHRLAAATSIEEKFADAARGECADRRQFKLSRCMFCGTCRTGRRGRAEHSATGAEARASDPGSINPEPLPGPGVQVRLDLQPQCGDSRQGPFASAGLGGDWPRARHARCLALDRRWFQLSGHTKHPPPHRVDGGSV